MAQFAAKPKQNRELQVGWVGVQNWAGRVREQGAGLPGGCLSLPWSGCRSPLGHVAVRCGEAVHGCTRLYTASCLSRADVIATLEYVRTQERRPCAVPVPQYLPNLKS